MYSPEYHKKCKFPFHYEGNIHWKCANTPHPNFKKMFPGVSSIPNLHPFWCATELDANLEMVEDKWGFCSDDCDSDLNVPGDSNNLPFKHLTDYEEFPTPRRNFAKEGPHRSRHPYYNRYYGHHYRG